MEQCGVCAGEVFGACPRCGLGLCAEHAVAPGKAHCVRCEEAISARVQSRVALRVAVDVSAGVGGVVGGAFLVMAAAYALGLAPEIAILFVLLAEFVFGGAAAVAADRGMLRYLHKKALNEGLPEARLLASGAKGEDRDRGGED